MAEFQLKLSSQVYKGIYALQDLIYMLLFLPLTCMFRKLPKEQMMMNKYHYIFTQSVKY